MLLMQATILIVLALPFGLSIHFTGVLVVLALIALLGLLMASVSYACALWLKSEDSFAPLIFTATLPLLLLSGVLLPLTLAPPWLRNIAAANPLSYAVDAARAIFNDHLGDASVEKGVLVAAVLAVIAVAIAVRSFGKALA
jgi:ABC-2 type transport system permease protein